MTHEPLTADDFFKQGMAAAQRSDWPAAKRAWQQALELRPTWSAAWNNLANVQRRLRELREAEESLLRAIAFSPTDGDYQFNLGNFYREVQAIEQAEQCYRNAWRLNPECIPAPKAISEICVRQNRLAEALAVWQKWIEIDPSAAEPLNQLGRHYREAEDFIAAERMWRQAIERCPQDPAAYGNLGQLLAEQGDEVGARDVYLAGKAKHPTPALQLLAGTVLPVILESDSHIDQTREQLIRNLDQLHAEGVRIDTSRECLPTLFYLAYHGRDDRGIHERVAQLAKSSTNTDITLRRRPIGKRLRLGVLSHFLRDHTIGRLNVGLVERLDRKQFEVTMIACESSNDSLAQRFRKAADCAVVLPTDVSAALAKVRELDLDILYYPDIGMIPFTYTLASHRLAPVQCATWGHPVTTGLGTIDYFLSSNSLEPAGSERFYTEKLIRLSRLGVYYDSPAAILPTVQREEFGFKPLEHVYICPQTLFKFHPQLDSLIAGVLRADPAGVLVLLEGRHPQWKQRLFQRWKRTIPDVCDRVRFLPKMPRARFIQALQASDVMLDTPIFGGGNTSYEALGVGLPIVTFPSPFLRSRLTAAMYSQMNLPEYIANSPDQYIQQAVALGTTPELRRDWSNNIMQRSSAIFADEAALAELQSTFLSWV